MANLNGDALHLGVNAVTLCFADQLPSEWIDQIRQRVETDCKSLGVPFEVETLLTLHGNIEAFQPQQRVIRDFLMKRSARLAACFDLGVTMILSVFGRDFALATRQVDSLFLPKLRNDAARAGLAWSRLDGFVAALKNDEIDGHSLVSSVFPRCALDVAEALKEEDERGHVFICHAEGDCELAEELADAIEQHGYSTWLYERDTLPGIPYLLQTREAIDRSLAVIILVSEKSMASNQLTIELVRAHECKKPIIPLLVDVSYKDVQLKQPEWSQAIGSAASLPIPTTGVKAITSRIVNALDRFSAR